MIPEFVIFKVAFLINPFSKKSTILYLLALIFIQTAMMKLRQHCPAFVLTVELWSYIMYYSIVYYVVNFYFMNYM